MSENTQLTTAPGYDTSRMIFSEPVTGTIPNSKPEIRFQRIIIQTRNNDGTTGELILPTTQLFSFGVSENVSQETGKVTGYSMPLCLWNRDGATSEETGWSDTFDNIVDECKKHLIANREEIGKFDLEMSDLKKFNSLYWKKDKGKVVEGTGPTLYAKLIVSKKQNKIVSMYYNSEGEEIDPLTLMGKYCHAKAAIKIESIFIGNKISLQCKLYECEVKLADTGMKRMMKKRPEGEKKVLVAQTNKPMDDDNAEGGDSDSDASVKDSDDEDKPVPLKKPVKRRVKKVKRVKKKLME